MPGFQRQTTGKNLRCRHGNFASTATAVAGTWSGSTFDTASGAKDRRPELNRLIADVHRRKRDAVLVWKLDRWWRSLRHLVSSLVGRAWGRFRFSVYPAQECASSVLGADFNLLGQLLDLLCLLDDRDRHGGCGVCHFHLLPKHKGQSV